LESVQPAPQTLIPQVKLISHQTERRWCKLKRHAVFLVLVSAQRHFVHQSLELEIAQEQSQEDMTA